MNDQATVRGQRDFASLIHPTDMRTFVNQYWEKKPLYLRRDDPDFYAGLISLADVDFMLNTHLGEADFPISLIGWKTESHQDRPARKPGPLSLDLDKVYDLYDQGATLRIGNTPRYLPALSDLAMAFENAINTPIAINAYLTPANANAFGAHFDNHDVYILQIEGSKHWRLYDPPEDLPVEVLIPGRTELFEKRLPDSLSVGIRPPVKKVTDLLLEAGDLLYVPRGHVHEVRTGDSHSLHLTVGAPVITWYEVLLNALPSVLPEMRPLRQGLAPGFAVDESVLEDLEKQAQQVSASLNGAVPTEKLIEALRDLSTRFTYTRRLPSRGLAADVNRLAALRLDTVLQVRPGLIYKMEVVREHVYLLFARTNIKVPLRAKSMLDYIHAHPRFTSSDLPTQLDDESRLVLTRGLLKQGFLEVVDTAGGEPDA